MRFLLLCDTIDIMVKAVFAGSFDPPTFGHLNIIERAQKLFSEIHVVIAVNKNKNYLIRIKPDNRNTLIDMINYIDYEKFKHL